jgi:hypothetical protein
MLEASDSDTGLGPLAPLVRVSDRDRELAARRLRDAASAGALNVSELDWRLDRVLSAATRGQLEAVLLDIPAPHPPVRASWLRRWLSPHIAAYAIVNGGLMAIWAVAGCGYFWPEWPMIGWGMALAGHAYAAWSPAAGGP